MIFLFFGLIIEAKLYFPMSMMFAETNSQCQALIYFRQLSIIQKLLLKQLKFTRFILRKTKKSFFSLSQRSCNDFMCFPRLTWKSISIQYMNQTHLSNQSEFSAGSFARYCLLTLITFTFLGTKQWYLKGRDKPKRQYFRIRCLYSSNELHLRIKKKLDPIELPH